MARKWTECHEKKRKSTIQNVMNCLFYFTSRNLIPFLNEKWFFFFKLMRNDFCTTINSFFWQIIINYIVTILFHIDIIFFFFLSFFLYCFLPIKSMKKKIILKIIKNGRRNIITLSTFRLTIFKMTNIIVCIIMKLCIYIKKKYYDEIYILFFIGWPSTSIVQVCCRYNRHPLIYYWFLNTYNIFNSILLNSNNQC